MKILKCRTLKKKLTSPWQPYDRMDGDRMDRFSNDEAEADRLCHFLNST